MGAKKKVIDPATVEYLPCSTCKETKHHLEFFANKQAVGRGGRDYICKACDTEAQRALRVKKLADMPREPIYGRYGQVASLEETAKAIGSTPKTVSNIERGALRKLRLAFAELGIRAEDLLEM